MSETPKESPDASVRRWLLPARSEQDFGTSSPGWQRSAKQERHNRQLEKLAEQIFSLAKDVQRMAGRMEGFEKRFDDKDRMVEAVISYRVREEIDKLRADLLKIPPASGSA